MLAFWAQIASQSMRITLYKRVIFSVVLAVVLFVLAGIIVFFATHGDASKAEGNIFYDLVIIIVAIVFLVGALLFCILGCISSYKIKRRQAQGGQFGAAFVRMSATTTIFTMCFLSRAAMFLYRPVFKAKMNYSVFVVFAYLVPECVPVLTQVGRVVC